MSSSGSTHASRSIESSSNTFAIVEQTEPGTRLGGQSRAGAAAKGLRVILIPNEPIRSLSGKGRQNGTSYVASHANSMSGTHNDVSRSGSPFAITVLAGEVTVTEDGTGMAVFTVTNATDQTHVVWASVVADHPAQPDWFTFRDSEDPRLATARIGTAEATQFVIGVDIPDDVAAGTYMFRLRVASEEDPDDVNAESQTVPVKVPKREPPPPPPRKPPEMVWIPAFLGALAAGGLALILTFIAGAVAARSAEGFDILGVIFFFIGIALLGVWIGGIVGAYLGLRLRRQSSPIWKATAFAVISLVVGIFFSILFSWIDIDGAALGLLILIMSLVATYAAAAYLSVRVVEWLRARRQTPAST